MTHTVDHYPHLFTFFVGIRPYAHEDFRLGRADEFRLHHVTKTWSPDPAFVTIVTARMPVCETILKITLRWVAWFRPGQSQPCATHTCWPNPCATQQPTCATCVGLHRGLAKFGLRGSTGTPCFFSIMTPARCCEGYTIIHVPLHHLR